MSEPALEADRRIDADNIRAAAAIYYAYALEELRIFRVVDRLAHLFAQGLLPIGDAPTKDALLASAFRNERLTGRERRDAYHRVFGVAADDVQHAKPNTEFLGLWMGFLVAVAASAEQHPAAEVLAPPSTSNAQARAAARALAANVSAYADAPTTAVAAKLLAQVQAAVDVLGRPDLLHAYRARDAWQLIDLVNRAELGGPRDVVRYRTQALAGRAILQWLADHGALLDGASAAAGAAPSTTADGQALVDAVDRLLGVIECSANEDDEAPPDPDAVGVKLPPDVPETVRKLLDPRNLAAPRDAHRTETLPKPGVVTVFQGGRHSGKTLAAYRAAQKLGKDVYRVDLSQVAGQYIGETEKNLDAAFRRAEESGAVLLIDEADTLFARRSDVRDAHDRYANVDVEQLLQRMEKHAAPVIVATNRRNHIDPAFVRRLRVVAFPRRAG